MDKTSNGKESGTSNETRPSRYLRGSPQLVGKLYALSYDQSAKKLHKDWSSLRVGSLVLRDQLFF